MVPSSIMTLSPKTLTSIAPFARSTNLVRTSLIALLRALISMAQTPNMIDFELVKCLQSSKVSLRTERLDPYFDSESLESSVNAKSEYEAVEVGEGDLVVTELCAILNGSSSGLSIFWSIPLVQKRFLWLFIVVSDIAQNRPPKVTDFVTQIHLPNLPNFLENPRDNIGLARAFEPCRHFVKIPSLKNRTCPKVESDP